MDILLVIDMQNDFVAGKLGSPEALKIVPNVIETVKNFKGKILFTHDTHHDDYMQTQEGRNLPIIHCVEGTHGWEIIDGLKPYVTEVIDKPGFGSLDVLNKIYMLDKNEHVDSIKIIGLCTDVCVIVHAMMLKAAFTEIPITIDAKCVAGVTPEGHRTAINAMKNCQIYIENDNT